MSKNKEVITSYLYCYRGGDAYIGTRRVPDGALELATFTGDTEQTQLWEQRMTAKLRHAKKGKSKGYLVPGVPEAVGDREAEAAARVFILWVTDCEKRFFAKQQTQKEQVQ